MESSNISMICSMFPRLSFSVDNGMINMIDGFFTIINKDYYIQLLLPNFPNTKQISLFGDLSFTKILQNCKQEISEINNDELQASVYLNCLHKICTKYVESTSNPILHPGQTEKSFYFKLLNDIEQLGWDKFTYVAKDFSVIHIKTKDAKERTHKLELTVTKNYPLESPIIEANIPVNIEWEWYPVSGLANIISKWEEVLQGLQSFWNVLDKVDSTVVVLDPLIPTYKDKTRRLLLENQISVHVAFYPECPFDPPQCQFLGASSLTAPISDRLMQQEELWDYSRDIIQNLEHLFGAPLVYKRTIPSTDANIQIETDFEDIGIECIICYCLHLNERLPDISCDECRKTFHLQCLYEWLKNLPSSRQDAQFIKGECPYCTKPITCQVPL